MEMIMPTISIKDVKKAFDALELAPTTDKKLIKKTSRNLLKTVHPDRTKSTATEETESRTRAINEAREILLNTLSSKELLDFVSLLTSNPLNHLPSAVSPLSSQSRDQNLDNTINVPSVIRIIKRPDPKSFITVHTLHPVQKASFLGGLFGSAAAPVEPPRTPPLSLRGLFIGDANSGKMEFFDQAFKKYDSTTDFKVVKFDKVTYQLYCMASEERFRSITQGYYNSANMMAFFGDYSTVVDWISKTQERLTLHQQQEEQLELYYVSYVDGTLNLHPWGDITEDEFNHNQTLQKIPSEHVHQFINQLFNEITNIMLSLNTPPNHDRIQGDPGSTR